jgi:sigma-E factor negative regulatory protein RseA
MTQKLREQISALADHELPEGEHELLLRRFSVEKSLRLHWERYHLIGCALRKELPPVDTRGFADRVMAVLSDEPLPAAPPEKLMDKLLRGAAGLAIAASVAVVAIVGLKHGGAHPGANPGEIVPTSVAAGETSPVDLMNAAGWNGEQVPVHASLDSALVDQEGTSPLGTHGIQSHRYSAKSLQDEADQARKDAQTRKPPRQY